MKAELKKLETSLGGGAQTKLPVLIGGSSAAVGGVAPSERGDEKRLSKPSERAMAVEEEEDSEQGESSDDEVEDERSA